MKWPWLLVLLIIPQTVLAASVQWNTEYTIDATQEKPTYEELVSIQANKPGYFYKEFSITSPFDIETAEIIGGKACTLDRIDSKSYLCKFHDGLFSGEAVQMRFTGQCNCTQKSGISIFVALPGLALVDDMEGELKQTIFFPRGFQVFNTTLKNYNQGTNSVQFSISLSANQNTKDMFGNLFFDFKKKTDFSKMKTNSLSKFTINYPSGFEKEAQKILQDYSKSLAFLEKQSNITLDHVTVNIVSDSSEIGDWGGLTSIFETNVSLFIDAFDDTYLHELCHTTEYPYKLPAWFSEGQAITCDIKLNRNLGFSDIAKEKEDSNSDVSGSLILANWKPTENYNENKEENDLGYKYSYLFFKDLEKSGLSRTELFTGLRQNFGSLRQEINTEEILCSFNQTQLGLEPVFEKYGFELGSCESLKTKKIVNSLLDKNLFYILLAVVAILVIIAIIKR